VKCSTCDRARFRSPVCYRVLSRSDPVEADLQKLISEYCAIEKMDRIVRPADQRDETELIGLRVREMRRREILLELTKWIIVAEGLVGRRIGQETED